MKRSFKQTLLNARFCYKQSSEGSIKNGPAANMESSSLLKTESREDRLKKLKSSIGGEKHEKLAQMKVQAESLKLKKNDDQKVDELAARIEKKESLSKLQLNTIRGLLTTELVKIPPAANETYGSWSAKVKHPHLKKLIKASEQSQQSLLELVGNDWGTFCKEAKESKQVTDTVTKPEAKQSRQEGELFTKVKEWGNKHPAMATAAMIGGFFAASWVIGKVVGRFTKNSPDGKSRSVLGGALKVPLGLVVAGNILKLDDVKSLIKKITGGKVDVDNNRLGQALQHAGSFEFKKMIYVLLGLKVPAVAGKLKDLKGKMGDKLKGAKERLEELKKKREEEAKKKEAEQNKEKLDETNSITLQEALQRTNDNLRVQVWNPISNYIAEHPLVSAYLGYKIAKSGPGRFALRMLMKGTLEAGKMSAKLMLGLAHVLTWIMKLTGKTVVKHPLISTCLVGYVLTKKADDLKALKEGGVEGLKKGALEKGQEAKAATLKGIHNIGQIRIPTDKGDFRKLIRDGLKEHKPEGESELPKLEDGQIDVAHSLIVDNKVEWPNFMQEMEAVAASATLYMIRSAGVSKEIYMHNHVRAGFTIFKNDLFTLRHQEKNPDQKKQYHDLMVKVDEIRLMLKDRVQLSSKQVSELKDLAKPLNIQMETNSDGYLVWSLMKNGKPADGYPVKICVDPSYETDDPEERLSLARRIVRKKDGGGFKAVSKAGEVLMDELRLMYGKIIFKDKPAPKNPEEATKLLEDELRKGTGAIISAGGEVYFAKLQDGIWHKYALGPKRLVEHVLKFKEGKFQMTEAMADYAEGLIPVTIVSSTTAGLKGLITGQKAGFKLTAFKILTYPVSGPYDAAKLLVNSPRYIHNFPLQREVASSVRRAAKFAKQAGKLKKGAELSSTYTQLQKLHEARAHLYTAQMKGVNAIKEFDKAQEVLRNSILKGVENIDAKTAPKVLEMIEEQLKSQQTALDTLLGKAPKGSAAKVTVTPKAAAPEAPKAPTVEAPEAPKKTPKKPTPELTKEWSENYKTWKKTKITPQDLHDLAKLKDEAKIQKLLESRKLSAEIASELAPKISNAKNYEQVVEALKEAGHNRIKFAPEISRGMKLGKALGTGMAITGFAFSSYEAGSAFYEAATTSDADRRGILLGKGGMWTANMICDGAGAWVMVAPVFGTAAGGAATTLGAAALPLIPITYMGGSAFEQMYERTKTIGEWMQKNRKSLIHDWMTTTSINAGDKYRGVFSDYGDMIKEKQATREKIVAAIINLEEGQKPDAQPNADRMHYMKVMIGHRPPVNFQEARMHILQSKIYAKLMQTRRGQQMALKQNPNYQYKINGINILDPKYDKVDRGEMVSLLEALKQHNLKNIDKDLMTTLDQFSVQHLSELYAQSWFLVSAGLSSPEHTQFVYQLQGYLLFKKQLNLEHIFAKWMYEQFGGKKPGAAQVKLLAQKASKNLKAFLGAPDKVLEQDKKNAEKEEGVYPMFKYAQFFGYTGGNTEKELRTFFRQEYDGVHGVYWDESSSQWYVNQTCYNVDAPIGRVLNRSTVNRVIAHLEREWEVMFSYRAESLVDKTTADTFRKDFKGQVNALRSILLAANEEVSLAKVESKAERKQSYLSIPLKQRALFHRALGDGNDRGDFAMSRVIKLHQKLKANASFSDIQDYEVASFKLLYLAENTVLKEKKAFLTSNIQYDKGGLFSADRTRGMWHAGQAERNAFKDVLKELSKQDYVLSKMVDNIDPVPAVVKTAVAQYTKAVESIRSIIAKIPKGTVNFPDMKKALHPFNAFQDSYRAILNESGVTSYWSEWRKDIKQNTNTGALAFQSGAHESSARNMFMLSNQMLYGKAGAEKKTQTLEVELREGQLLERFAQIRIADEGGDDFRLAKKYIVFEEAGSKWLVNPDGTGLKRKASERYVSLSEEKTPQLAMLKYLSQNKRIFQRIWKEAHLDQSFAGTNTKCSMLRGIMTYQQQHPERNIAQYLSQHWDVFMALFQKYKAKPRVMQNVITNALSNRMDMMVSIMDKNVAKIREKREQKEGPRLRRQKQNYHFELERIEASYKIMAVSNTTFQKAYRKRVQSIQEQVSNQSTIKSCQEVYTKELRKLVKDLDRGYIGSTVMPGHQVWGKDYLMQVRFPITEAIENSAIVPALEVPAERPKSTIGRARMNLNREIEILKYKIQVVNKDSSQKYLDWLTGLQKKMDKMTSVEGILNMLSKEYFDYTSGKMASTMYKDWGKHYSWLAEELQSVLRLWMGSRRIAARPI